MRKSRYWEKMLLENLPDGGTEKMLLVEKIRKYRTECGCSMGAKFLVAAIVAVVLYLVIFNHGQRNLIWNGVFCLSFIFISAGLGKLTGIGIARLRLGILLRSAYKKLMIIR